MSAPSLRVARLLLRRALWSRVRALGRALLQKALGRHRLASLLPLAPARGWQALPGGLLQQALGRRRLALLLQRSRAVQARPRRLLQRALGLHCSVLLQKRTKAWALQALLWGLFLWALERLPTRSRSWRCLSGCPRRIVPLFAQRALGRHRCKTCEPLHPAP